MKIEVHKYEKIISSNKLLSNINMSLSSGHIYGFQGKNGSGKTMLMRAISGLILPTSGYVEVDGKRVGKDIDFPQDIGVLIENPGFIGSYSGFQNLKLLSSLKNKVKDEQICKLMKQLSLDPNDSKKYKKYSLGMKQKLGIIAAIMENPEIIILDEPFNALDEKSCDIVNSILFELKANNRIIIVSCHDKEELFKIADVVYVIENGEVKKTIDVKAENNN
ncbi:MAG: ABC transporter ATP-binding protein [Oscillospiraceae bacterium]|nr:ABC transporter ATP-binding protein [Oscillospiraceae bacterium]